MFFVSFRRETWCCPVWQYEGLRMHENRAMTRIFGPKRDTATAWWGKLHVVMRSFVVDLVFCVWEVKLPLEERQLSGRRILRREDKLKRYFNPLNAELNPICHFLALLGGATIVVVSRLRVKESVRDMKFSQ